MTSGDINGCKILYLLVRIALVCIQTSSFSLPHDVSSRECFEFRLTLSFSSQEWFEFIHAVSVYLTTFRRWK